MEEISIEKVNEELAEARLEDETVSEVVESINTFIHPISSDYPIKEKLRQHAHFLLENEGDCSRIIECGDCFVLNDDKDLCVRKEAFQSAIQYLMTPLKKDEDVSEIVQEQGAILDLVEVSWYLVNNKGVCFRNCDDCNMTRPLVCRYIGDEIRLQHATEWLVDNHFIEKVQTTIEENVSEVIEQQDTTSSIEDSADIKSQYDVQVGGEHYKKYKIQPLDFAISMLLDPQRYASLKYVIREKGNRIEDLNKAKHYLQLFMEDFKVGRLEPFIVMRQQPNEAANIYEEHDKFYKENGFNDILLKLFIEKLVSIYDLEVHIPDAIALLDVMIEREERK